ncbi:unnamed protein product [Mycena citricolor]|uniref:Exoribonuclease phosphorolytic domain-containing protein n=1 Tax=Mycena citricolor TaxID=2018698 RepID=A0AAD2I1H3_9AGAR|nr:unnamed protein product [Mycena citricolor]
MEDTSRRGPSGDPATLRSMKISLDRLARVDGSARFSFGKSTVALASISGPVEVRLAAENPSLATFEVLLRPLSNVPNTQSKSLAAAIRAALLPSLILSQHPRTLIQLVVQALSPVRSPAKNTPDALVAAMINASTVALLNAGSVPMKAVVCAVAVGKTRAALVVDPSEDEGPLDASGCFAFAFGGEPDVPRCVWSNWRSVSPEGLFDEDELAQARSLALVAAKSVLNGIKTALRPGSGDEDSEEDEGDEDDKMEIS